MPKSRTATRSRMVTRVIVHRALARLPPKRSAKAAGLIYMHDDRPGISRQRVGRGFSYRGPTGRVIRGRALIRIRALAIPPAWQRVWIAPIENSHLQATGIDARGRKQYRYHDAWQQVRNLTKFHRLREFGQSLASIRARLDEALSLPGLPREKILACVIRLLDVTGARVGNKEYAESNGSFGLTTLCNKHVEIDGPRLKFKFRGKSGVAHRLELVDRRLARVIARCSELPGELLFQYVGDDGLVHPIGSGDVNALLKDWTGGDFTAKDFRTWAGTVLFYKVISTVDTTIALTATTAVKEVAKQLRNTSAVCRKFYIHPLLLDDFAKGKFVAAESVTVVQTQTFDSVCLTALSTPETGLSTLEHAVLKYLEKIPQAIRIEAAKT